jgi:hypothetical protein
MPTLSACFRGGTSLQAYTVHTRDTTIRSSQRRSEYIHVYVPTDAGYDTNFNAVGMEMPREKSTQYDCRYARNKKETKLSCLQQSTSKRRGTVAADMHRSPGLDHPTSFLPGGDSTPWPRSESQFLGGHGDKGFVGDASNRSSSVSRYITQSRSKS